MNLPPRGDILREMTVYASLVVASNGATSLNGRSSGLSTAADRARFLQRHRSAAAFIIGKKSAAIEDYSASQVPIFIFTRSHQQLSFAHPLMQQVTVDRNLAEITELIDLRISGDIVVEAGASLLQALIDVGVVDILELSISPIAGDGDFINLDELISHFDIASDDDIDGTRLLECRYQRNSANG